MKASEALPISARSISVTRETRETTRRVFLRATGGILSTESSRFLMVRVNAKRIRRQRDTKGNGGKRDHQDEEQHKTPFRVVGGLYQAGSEL